MSTCDCVRVIAQQCSSVNSFSVIFHSRKENFRAGLKNCKHSSKLLKSEIASFKCLKSRRFSTIILPCIRLTRYERDRDIISAFSYVEMGSVYSELSPFNADHQS